MDRPAEEVEALIKTNAGCDFVAVDLENAFMTDPPLDAQAHRSLSSRPIHRRWRSDCHRDHAERANYDQTRKPTVAEKFELPSTVLIEDRRF